MIPREYRLPPQEFKARDYTSISTPYFSIQVRKNKTSVNRLGIIIGNAAIKNAADRNFWRRQIKKLFLDIPHEGLDLLFVFRRRITFPPVQIFQKTVRDAFLSAQSIL